VFLVVVLVAGAAGLGGTGADPLVGGVVVLVDGLAGDWGAGPVEFLAG
jgi:hypothetical protein